MIANPAVARPRAVAALERDHRGFPVFYAVARHEDGRPNWKGLDGLVVARCVRDRLCVVCGCTLGLRVAFVGGPLSVDTLVFQEPPMHPPCAEYATAVCPFLVRAGWDRTRTPFAERLKTDDPGGSMTRWDGVAVVVVDAVGYRPRVGPTTVLFEVLASPHRVTWVVGPREKKSTE